MTLAPFIFTLAFALVFAAALPSSSSYSTWMESAPPKLAMEIKSTHDDDGGPIMLKHGILGLSNANINYTSPTSLHIYINNPLDILRNINTTSPILPINNINNINTFQHTQQLLGLQAQQQQLLL
eukprot:113557_1